MNKHHQLEAIAKADAYANSAGLPTYSDLVALLQRVKTVTSLMADDCGMPQYGRDAAALLARIPA